MTGVLVREGEDMHRDTQRGRPCEEIGVMTDTSRGTLRITSNHQKWGERHGTAFPSESPEGANGAQHPDFVLLAT